MIDLNEALTTDNVYIKPIKVDGGMIYEIHNVNGKPIQAFLNWDVAAATARIHDLVPMSMH